MIFTRTLRYHTTVSQDDIRNRLLGNHLTIHDLDFEVCERGQKLRVIPHAEDVDDIKTLPITDIEFKQDGGKQPEVVITFKMRRLDSGGPLLIVVFCCFLLVAAGILTYVGRERYITYTLLSLTGFIFGVFWIRLEMGYFDYIRKITNHIRSLAF